MKLLIWKHILPFMKKEGWLPAWSLAPPRPPRWSWIMSHRGLFSELEILLKLSDRILKFLGMADFFFSSIVPPFEWGCLCLVSSDCPTIVFGELITCFQVLQVYRQRGTLPQMEHIQSLIHTWFIWFKWCSLGLLSWRDLDEISHVELLP